MTAPSNSANGAMLSPTPTAIETYSGQFVDLAQPDPGTLRLDDIAQGLALTCRYGGQIRRFYSIAEHAVLVHDLLNWQGASEELQVAGLFHDAAESYLGDVVAPLKYALRAGECIEPVGFRSTYDVLTDRLDTAIGERYVLDLLSMDSEHLRTADMWALRIEARALTHTGGAHWRWPGELPHDGQLPVGVEWAGGRRAPFARQHWLDAVARHGIVERVHG